MNNFQIFWHNLRVTDPRDRLIKCKRCGMIQRKAYRWDWQRCICGNYLYDTRL